MSQKSDILQDLLGVDDCLQLLHDWFYASGLMLMLIHDETDGIILATHWHN